MLAKLWAEFSGGPYDGCNCIEFEGEDAPPYFDIPVSQNVLRVLNGEAPGRPAPIQAVSIYRLVEPERLLYRYLKTRRVYQDEVDEITEWYRSAMSASMGNESPLSGDF